ncbi:MAG: hypothetical protein HY390_06510 [Deltaproteobacteria bacterium]|nr:hypothetical protein [Deltaproteobacteria bacterium]
MINKIIFIIFLLFSIGSYAENRDIGFKIEIDTEKILRFKDKTVPKILEILSQEGIKIIRVDKMQSADPQYTTIPDLYEDSQKEWYEAQLLEEPHAVGVYYAIQDHENTGLNPPYNDLPTIALLKNATLYTILHEYLHHLITLFQTHGRGYLWLGDQKKSYGTIVRETFEIPYLNAKGDYQYLLQKSASIKSEIIDNFYRKYLSLGVQHIKYTYFKGLDHLIIPKFLYEHAEVFGDQLNKKEILEDLIRTLDEIADEENKSLKEMIDYVQKTGRENLKNDEFLGVFFGEQDPILTFIENSETAQEYKRIHDWTVSTAQKDFPELIESSEKNKE